MPDSVAPRNTLGPNTWVTVGTMIVTIGALATFAKFLYEREVERARELITISVNQESQGKALDVISNDVKGLRALYEVVDRRVLALELQNGKK